MVFAFYTPFLYLSDMFIRQVKKKNSSNGKTFLQYQLLQAARVGGKVKHQNILYLGSEPLLADKETRRMTLELLQARIYGQSQLFAKDFPKEIVGLVEAFYQKFLIKYKDVSLDDALALPPSESDVQLETIDIESIEIENSRTFGGEHLCNQVMEMLNLGQCFTSLGLSKNEQDLAHISIIGRALFSASEYKTSQYLRNNSSLCSLYNMDTADVNHRHLYTIADKLYSHKETIDKFIYNRVVDMFELEDSLVIYDLSNTYFEGRKAESKRARFGKSKQKRNDCKQVVFTGVINAQGFIRYSRIYDGNTADIATLPDMVADLKRHSGAIKDKTVVMDAGFASEDNLRFLVDQGLHYVCVSRKRLKDYTVNDSSKVHRITDRRNNPIELVVFTPEQYQDTWMYVKSEQKRVKEESMAEKLSVRFEQELEGLSAGLQQKGTTKNIQKVWERIGRLREKHRMVSGKYTIEVEQEKNKAVSLCWNRKQESHDLEDKKDSHGVYFIRTSYQNPNENQLWQVYNIIREVEATFRCLKSDLHIRPIHHQNDLRTESHIYLTILSYQLVNTIRFMLKRKGISHDWKNIVRIMNTQTIQELILPTETKKISLIKPSRPIKEALDIYQATNTKSMTPTKKKYVVYH
jgi:hypothetical protein